MAAAFTRWWPTWIPSRAGWARRCARAIWSARWARPDRSRARTCTSRFASTQKRWIPRHGSALPARRERALGLESRSVDLLATLQRMVRRGLVKRGAKSSTAMVGRHQVHYYEVAGSGSGAPVLLVHGLGGSANGVYKILFPLRRRF